METNNVFFLNNHESEQLDQLFTALSQAQGEFDKARLVSTNPHFSSKFADLEEMIDASRPALVKYGLSVQQKLITHESVDYLVTKLGHSSGQWTQSCVALRPAREDQQAFGSAMTYKKRYSYGTLIGLSNGYDDDDGEDDRKHHETREQPATQYKKQQQYPQKQISPDEIIVKEQYSQLVHELSGLDDTTAAFETRKIQETYGINTLKNLSKNKFQFVLDQIRNIKKS